MPVSPHLSTAELERLLFGDARRTPALFDGFLHLRQCGDCRRELLRRHPQTGARFLARAFPTLPGSRSGSEGLGGSTSYYPAARWERLSPQALEKLAAVRRRVMTEENDAPALYRELVTHPPERWLLLVRNVERYRSMGLANLCLRTAREHFRRDARLAEELARLAVTVLDELPYDVYGAGLLADRRALAWAYVANSVRAGGTPAAAVSLLERAEEWRLRGQGGLWERAWLCRFQASLARDLRDFPSALAAADEAAVLFERLGEKGESAWMEVQRASIRRDSGDEEGSVVALEAFFARVDLEEIPWIAHFGALQNLAYGHARLGRVLEAERLLPEVRRLARQRDEPLTDARVSWIEALVRQAKGDVDGAATVFRGMQQVFLDHRDAYDAAIVTLELVSLYLEADRTAEAGELAAELVPIFRSVGLEREALGSLRLFCAALEREVASAAMARDAMFVLSSSPHRLD
jgi:hypothetical protein